MIEEGAGGRAQDTHVVTTYQVPTPTGFNFAKPEEWIRRFERFQQALGLHAKEGGVQVNTRLYSMGSESDDIMLSFKLTEAESSNIVKDKFEAHFVKKTKEQNSICVARKRMKQWIRS